jgi:peptide/nickel transport system permease protein
VVVGKHALKNASVPIVTVFGLQVRRLLGGTVIVEQIFNVPGIGSLIVKSVFERDLPVVLGITVVSAVVVLLVNLLVDLSYGYLDPRVRG